MMVKKPTYKELEQKIKELEKEINFLRSAESDLKYREAFLDRIIEQSPFAIWISDKQGTLQRANPALKRFLNLTDAQLVGKYNVFKDPFAKKQGLIPLIRTVYEQGKSIHFICDWDGNDIPDLNLKGSKSVTIEATMFPILNSKGEITNVVINWIDITERKRSEEALRKNEAHLKTLIQTIPDLIWLKDADGVYLSCNQMFERFFGAKEFEIIGKTDYDYVDKDLADFFREHDRKAMAAGAPSKNEEELIFADDGYHGVFETIKTPMYDLDGTLIGVLGIARDISDQKRMMVKLDENEKKYRSLFDNAQVALFRTSIDGQLMEINKRYAETAGYSTIEDCMAEFSPGKAWSDPNARNEFLNRIQKKGSVSDYESKIIRKDGTEAWILFSATLFPDQGCIEGSILDITGRKQAEESIRQSEALQRKMFANIGDVIVIIDKEGINRYKSPNIEKLFGWKPEHVVGKSTLENIHPDDLASERIFFETLMGEMNKVKRTEFRYRCKDGSYKWIEFIGTNLFHDPDICGILGNYHDITNRKAAEKSLRESESRFKTLHNASFGGIAIHDKGIILECNQGLSDITGYSVDELIGMDGLLLIAEQSRPVVMKNILSNDEKPYEAIALRKNGEEYPIRLEGRNLPYKGKNVRTVEFRDITEQKKATQDRQKLQDQLIQAQKMESVGRLAGGVAHDFNNMLSIILGNTEILLEDLGASSHANDYLHEIQKAAERSSNLTRQLLAFARKQTISPKTLDLNQAVAGMLKMLKRLIGENIDLSWHPKKGLWGVKIDPSQVDQILANLCVNARDAIKDVGKITIETDNVHFDQNYCKDHMGFIPGNYVLIALTDSGSGMPKKTINNLFEPFFTTKGIGKGTGLGLATVYGIVKQNKGFINVYSELEEGTVFRIYLPKHTVKIKTQEQKIPVEVSPRGKEKILLVEDEKAILKMVKSMLERLGYIVLPAYSPEEALQISEKPDTGGIDLLITDVVMPRMNGRDLARKLSKSYPNLKFLFMSGYTANVIAHHGILDEGLNFINKPFSKQALARKLREILDK